MARINDENYTTIVGLSVPQNALVAAKTQQGSVRKQAFGELKNVMHNTQATPVGKLSNMFCQPVSICKDAFKKQQKHNIRPSIAVHRQLSPSSLSMEEEEQDEDLYDYFDHNSCAPSCHKTDQEIWSEMDPFDTSMLTNIMCSDCPDEDPEHVQADEIFRSTTPLIEDINITSYLKFAFDEDLPLDVPEMPPYFEDDHFAFDESLII